MESSIKTKIINFVNDNNLSDQNIDDLSETVLDYLLDNDIVDLSDDEDGDVYEFLEEKFGN